MQVLRSKMDANPAIMINLRKYLLEEIRNVRRSYIIGHDDQS